MIYLLYFALITFLIFTPLNGFLSLFRRFEKLVNYLKIYLFIGEEIVNGQRLLDISLDGFKQRRIRDGSNFELPKYKYHTALLLTHFEHLFHFGGDWREKGALFRGALANDLQKEKECKYSVQSF